LKRSVARRWRTNGCHLKVHKAISENWAHAASAAIERVSDFCGDVLTTTQRDPIGNIGGIENGKTFAFS
jgi:hypothetical protein